MKTKRTLKEILDTPIEGAIPAPVDNSPIPLLDAIGTIMYRFSLSSQEELPQCKQIYTLLCELDALANAPAPDVNAELLFNSYCLVEGKLREAEADLNYKRTRLTELTAELAPALTAREEMERDTA